MKIGIIGQARSTSTRLPNKVMRKINGKPLLGYFIERLKQSEFADEIIIATTTNKSDDEIVNFSLANKVKVFRGSEDDVLSRYYFAAKENDLDIIIRVTSDCPLIDAKTIDNGTDFFVLIYPQPIEFNYVSNTICRTFPRGMDFEVFHFKSLEYAFENAKMQHQREHVTPFIYENPDRFNLYRLNYSNNENYSKYRLTVDTIEDFNLIKDILKIMDYKHLDYEISDIIKIMEENPNLLLINKNITQKKLK